MKLNISFKISSNVLPEGLKRYHDKVRIEDRHKVLNSYLSTILEAKARPGLFWIVPTKSGEWVLLLFHEYYEQYDDHESLWRNVVSDLVLDSFGMSSSENFKELFDAFPRGRVEIGTKLGEWLVGFGGDYPDGWDEDRLLSRLGMLPSRTEIEYDDHWRHDHINATMAMKILGSINAV